ncbi:DUF2497 domain-containing protein [Acuticoccus sp. I52.16.1]|nr:DUF2497 domain-containing protein [Acuticoccus sp. I52.16.1]
MAARRSAGASTRPAPGASAPAAWSTRPRSAPDEREEATTVTFVDRYVDPAGSGPRTPDPAPAPAGPAAGPAAAPPLDTLVSQATRLAATAAFEELAHSMHPADEPAPADRASAIEALAKEAMRPILREWIDTHLNTIVERLVREEIERMTGRR